MYSGSALVDLKAELSRKELEAGERSQNADITDHPGVILNKGRKQKNKTFEKIQELTSKKKKKRKDVEGESSSNQLERSSGNDEMDEAYEKAKQKMLAKTKIYEKMQSGQMEDVEDFQGETRYLVDFQQKLVNAEEEDVLADSNQQQHHSPSGSNKRTIASAAIFEANEEHREKLHEKWRQEQEDILNGPIHYENIKFDEIRELGTGYYAFSKDEEERKKQLEELQNMRKETISIQQRKDDLKRKRKAALQERLKKVKQRKALESGNPVLDELDDEVSTSQNDEITGTSRQEAAAAEIDDNLSDMLRECRNATTKKQREWDKGKQAGYVAQTFVKPRTTPAKMTVSNSYEKMLEERRNERPDEFAPPGFY